MKKKRFTPQQISSVLEEYENGKSVEEIVSDSGVSRTSFYKWRQCYGGMEASELTRLKQLEEEKSATHVETISETVSLILSFSFLF